MSDSTVIQPAPGQAILTTDTSHHRNHEQHHGHHDTVEMANYRAITGQVERFGTTNGDRITAVGAAGALAAGHTDQLVLEGDARTRELGQAGFGGVHDRLCDAKSGIVGALGSGFAADALASCKTDDAIADVKLFNAVQFKDQVIEANKNAANLSTLVQTVGNAAQVLASSIGNAASVQATANYNGIVTLQTNTFNQTTVQIERVRAELDAKVAAGFAAAALLATQLDAQARREADECCCKLTALVIEQGNATRAQGADFRMRDLEQRLTATQRLIPVTIPVGAG